MKKIKSLLLSGMLIIILSACGTTTTNEPESTAPETSSQAESMGSEQSRVFTLDELKQYNGKNGNPAYVAVDGVVYDVTDVKPWANGEHKNGITAGNELSDEILKSPHGKKVLKNLPVVGTLDGEQ